MSKLGTERARVILSQMPQAAGRTRGKRNKGSLLMLLAWWAAYDGIDLPPEVAEKILNKATPPESIARYRRWALQAEQGA